MKKHYRFIWILINLLLDSIWKLKREGENYIPSSGGVIIASNHKAYFDPPLLGSASKREFFFLAKKELFKIGFLGWFFKKCNTIPIYRGTFDREGLVKAVDVLKRGKALVLFPEGTRIKNKGWGKPRLGVGKIALEAEVPVVPAYIYGSDAFFRSIFKSRRIKVSFGPAIEREWLKKLPKDKQGYKILVEEIMRRIKSLAFKTKLG
ncbi:MAG: hypothetical protein AMJ90_03280 [candidate division Zixibacteria bacterium SM23_73_2]|nr:MAG: hypothetical protein AMJ90_03280 [candidate division Zixibacteria bacterium SM23_73_2]